MFPLTFFCQFIHAIRYEYLLSLVVAQSLPFFLSCVLPSSLVMTERVPTMILLCSSKDDVLVIKHVCKSD